MPTELKDKPYKRNPPFRFTAENGAEFGRLGAKVMLERKAQRESEWKAAILGAIDKSQATSELQWRLLRLRKQIQRIETKASREMRASAILTYTSIMEKLLDMEIKLVNLLKNRPKVTTQFDDPAPELSPQPTKPTLGQPMSDPLRQSMSDPQPVVVSREKASPTGDVLA